MTGISDHRARKTGTHLSGLAEAQLHYDAVLCDIWGVLHDGERGFPAAAQALAQLRRLGKAVTLITNAPRPSAEIAAQLATFGVTPDSYDAIASSGDVCARAIAERAPQRPYHLGPARDLPVFEGASVMAGRAIAPVPLGEADFVVCTGLDDDIVETPDDYDDILSDMRKKNLTMICANPDLVVHRGEQLCYCAGALAERYEEMGGEVEQAGKPFAPIYRLALGLAERARQRPLDIARVLAIGDAMHTDIAGAQAMGIDSLLITSGIHRGELHRGQLHGLKKGEIDGEAYKQFVESHDVTPSYRTERLIW
jgi:HAD superfamily hydrolase (TIGR01459 family)